MEIRPGRAVRLLRRCSLPGIVGWREWACQIQLVPKKITITISDEAAEENISVSKLVGEMLERQMRLTDDHRQAFERWKSRQTVAGTGAVERMSRERTHERS